MVPDTQKVWTDGRNGRTDTRTTQKSDLPTSSGDNSERESRVQQHVSKYYARRHPPSDPWSQNSTFFRTWSCCISKGIGNAATW